MFVATATLFCGGLTAAPNPLTTLHVAEVQQNRDANGTIVDANGEPLIGATVVLKGSTSIGTTTDATGHFSLNVPQNAILVIKYIGYKTQEVAAGNNLRIVLQEDGNMLEEVVVQVAYGTQKRLALTGAVSTVSSEQLAMRPVSNLANALEGTLGVQTVSSTGQPGASPSLYVRGFGSVNGTLTPLYVIDGVALGGNVSDINPADVESVSVLKDASSTALYGSRASNGVVLITTKRGRSDQPNVNVSVRHGWSMRSIPDYDRLAADPWMETIWRSYRNYLMSSDPTTFDSFEKANAKTNEELIEVMLKYNIYNKPDDQVFNANGKLQASIRPGYLDDLNWFDQAIINGQHAEYNISTSGRVGNKSNYYVSVGYLDQGGYVREANFKRVSANARFSTHATDWLDLDFNLRGTEQDQSSMDTSGSGYLNIFSNARNMSPIYPVHLHDMATGEYILDALGHKQYDSGVKYGRPQMANRHTIWENELNSNKNTRKTLQGTLKGTVNLPYDIKAILSYDLETRTNNSLSYESAIIGDGRGNNGRGGFSDYSYRNYTFQQQLTWGKAFGKNWIDALLGHENYDYYYSYNSGDKSNEILAGNPYMNNYTSLTDISGNKSTYRLESYLARVRYNWNEQIFIDSSFRRDGSSRFYKDNRWGNFWSLGGSVILSSFDFWQSLSSTVDYAKLRASYGETGNDDLGAGYYPYMGLYSLQINGGLGAIPKSQYENLDLKWEAQTEFSIALELRLWNRVNLSVDYYDRRNRDLLFNVPLPTSVGVVDVSSSSPQIAMNIGTISNRGWEIGISGNVLELRDFTWNAGLNLAFNRNKILRLPELNREKGIISGIRKFTEGYNRNEIWTYQYVGVNMKNGRSVYLLNDEDYYIKGKEGENEKRIVVPDDQTVNIDGVDYVYKTTYAKRDWSGSGSPKYTGSFTTGFKWKNLSAGMLFTFAGGNKAMDYPYQSLMSVSASSPSALHEDILKSWNPETDATATDVINPNVIPVADPTYSPDVNATSTRFLINGGYIQLKNINLSYTLPQSFVQSLKLRKVTVGFSSDNVWLKTARKGLNSQMSTYGNISNYAPPIRTLMFDLKVEL